MKSNLLFLWAVILVLLVGCMGQTINEKELSQQRVVAKQHILQVAMNMSVQPKEESDASDQTLTAYRKEYTASHDVDEKRELLSTIAESNSADAINFLMEALNAKQPEVRQEAALQLENHLNKPNVISALIRTLGDKNDTVLLEAIESLSSIPDTRVIRKLTQISEQHPNRLIREVAMDYALQLKEK